MAGEDAFAVDGRGRGGGRRSFRLHVVASWRQFAIGALFLVCLVALVVYLGSSRLSPYRCDLGLSFTLTTFLLMLCIYFFFFFFFFFVFFLPVLLYALICFTIMYIRLNCIRLLSCTLRTRTGVGSRQKWSWQNVHIARINHIKESDCGSKSVNRYQPYSFGFR